MDKLLIAFGAALLALACAPQAEAGFNLRLGGVKSLVQTIDWDDVEYAREYARESAEEDAEDQGYRASRRSKASAGKSQAARRVRPNIQAARKSAPAETVVKTETTSSVPKFSERLPETAEPKETDEPEPKKAETKRAVATVDGDGCRKYFPSAGMTLSVPCE